MTQPSPNVPDDLMPRIMAYHDKTLSLPEIQALEAELKEDPQKRQQFIDLSLDISLIHGVLQDESHVYGNTLAPTTAKQTVFKRLSAAMIAAAVLVAALFLFTTSRAKSVGRLTYAKDVSWQTDSLIPSAQAVLPGSYHLTQGQLRLQMNQGTIVTMDAPSQFEIKNQNNIVLASGKISTVMAEGAPPFRVLTQHLEVIDIGTAFGLHVRDDGSSQVTVFEGSVQVRAPQGNPLLLKRGDSAQSSSTGQLHLDVFDAQPFSELWPLAKGIDQMSELVEFIPPGPQRPLTDYRHNQKLFLMPEQMNLKLGQKIRVDLTPETTRLPVQDRQPSLLEAKTISSYIVFFNGQVPETEGQHQNIQGQITFAQPILGVIYNEKRLTRSDTSLGLKDITYPQTQGRGLVCKPKTNYPFPLDSITIVPDGHTLHFDLYTTEYMDQFRVIVGGD
ncbi:FecR domain-containing protein [Planctomycetota bacterium]